MNNIRLGADRNDMDPQADKKMIYMDNAATSWPKPPCVVEAITDAILHFGGNPGRGGHRLALAAGELVYETRERVSSFFGCDDAFRTAFTQNITMAVNTVLQGFLTSNDHVLVSPMEHNAVMRPLQALGIPYDVIPGDQNGQIDPASVPEMIRPDTKLIIICHESNVNGNIQPIAEIGAIARANHIYMLADCAQSAGHMPIHIENDNIDFLCFTGHKGLLGPTGTGGIVFGSHVDIEKVRPLVYGGTGSLSESFDQPSFMPDRLESGTQNVCGLAGLNAGIRWIEEQGLEKLNGQCRKLISKLRVGIENIPGIRCFCGEGHVLSVTIDGLDNGTAAIEMESRYGIMTRIGLHCAPLAHRTLGTFPDGTIRFAVSPFTTDEEIDVCIQACRDLAEKNER